MSSTTDSVCESAGEKEKAAEEGGTRSRRIQPEPSGTSGLCLGITRHPCGKPHALIDVGFFNLVRNSLVVLLEALCAQICTTTKCC